MSFPSMCQLFRRSVSWRIVRLVVAGSLVISALRAAEDEQAQFKRAQELEAQKNFLAAEAIYSKLIEANPVEPTLYTMRGWVRHLQKNEKDALHDLDMADMMKANDPATLFRRGQVHRALEDPEKAVQDFTAVAAADPKNARVRYELAMTLGRTARHREALAAISEAIALEPKRADFVMLRSAIHEKLGEGVLALADADLARTLTSDPKLLAMIEQNRPRLAALAADKNPATQLGGLLPHGRPDPAKERTEALAAAATNAAKVEELPPAPPPPDLQVKFPERIDFRRLSKAEFRAAVSAAVEQLRMVLGPRSAEENAAFEKSWAPAFDFPCEPVVEYLNRLNPLLALFVSLRAAVGYTLERFNTTWEEAMTAAGFGAPAGADVLLAQARSYGGQLRTLRDDLAKVAGAIEQLGDPPNAAALKKHRHQQADSAIQYVQDIADGDLWTRLHDCKTIHYNILGRLTTRKAGNMRHVVGVNTLGYDPYDETGSSIETLACNNGRRTGPSSAGFVTWTETYVGTDIEVRSIEWLGRVFFGSRNVPATQREHGFGEESFKQGNCYESFCGVMSEDGRRLIDFFSIYHGSAKLNINGTHDGASLGSGADDILVMLHISGDKVRLLQDAPPHCFPERAIWFGAEDFSSDASKYIKPGDTAAMLKHFLRQEHRNYSGKGTSFFGHRGADISAQETVEVFDAQLTQASFGFDQEEWRNKDLRGIPDDQDYNEDETHATADLIRAEFDNPRPGMAKLVTPDSKGDSANAKFEKLAGMLRGQARDDALDAYRQAAEQTKKDEVAKQRDIVTYTKDITSIEEYLGTVRAQRDQAAQAHPRDDTLIKELDFRIVGQESETQAKRDLIQSLEKGVIVHTATPFDDMCRAQAVLAAQGDVDRLATIDRDRRTNAALQAKLDESERRNFVQKTGAMLDAGGGMDPAKWRALNNEAYTQVQAKLGADKNAADAETTAWERKVWAAETTATAADFSVGLLSGSGGYRAAGLVYSFTTSTLNNGLGQYYQSGSAQAGLKAGLFEGTKSVVTSLSDTIDYAWNAVDAYNQDPKAPFRDRMQSVVTAAGSKWLMSKATGYVSDAIAANIDLGMPSAQWKPTAKQSMAAAKHQQQMEMDEALARDFLDTYKQHRIAQLRAGGATTPDLDRLAAEVRRKACSVNASFGAKVYMKTQALPVEQRAYSRVIDDVHTELIPRFREQMAAGTGPKDLNGREAGKWGGHDVAPIRNASSAGTASMDFDLALRQQPNWLPDGAGGVRRNVWLTRNGEPASPHEFQEEGQRVWEQLYRKATGYSAKTSFENITTLDHSEAYRDLAWTKITRGPNGEVRGTDAIDWRWAQQAGDVTQVKHYEMLDRQPNLDHYSKLQESCRGTAKDIKSKVSTLLDEVAQKKGSSMNAADRQHLEEVRTFWNRVQQVTSDFGSGKTPPLEAERQIYLLSGGRGLDDLTDRVGTVIESLGKMKKK